MAVYLLARLHRLVTVTGDAGLVDIEREVSGYPNIVGLRERVDWSATEDAPSLLVPFRLEIDGVELSMFTTLTTFGTPLDITLDELAIELFFPTDEATTDHFHAIAATLGNDARNSA